MELSLTDIQTVIIVWLTNYFFPWYVLISTKSISAVPLCWHIFQMIRILKSSQVIQWTTATRVETFVRVSYTQEHRLHHIVLRAAHTISTKKKNKKKYTLAFSVLFIFMSVITFWSIKNASFSIHSFFL